MIYLIFGILVISFIRLSGTPHELGVMVGFGYIEVFWRVRN